MVYLDSETQKSDQFVVAEPIFVELFDSRVVVIPADFVSDGHSTPRLLDVLLPHYDAKTNLAAIVHDFLYMHWEVFEQQQKQLRAAVLECPSRLLSIDIDDPRAYADEAYYRLMEQMAPCQWRNGLYWVAVRCLGWWNWRGYRRNDRTRKFQ
ncbi:DUF1353 domain-containing protein [Fibrella aestuarina]|uniref:DUF1353 domain-containing protein n=1 Tax=Fibrella aestuarina TaxID=651143 RepID=UPI00130DB750|nr:DUF1353 domain-containing protein [Fibrella aestuarina]